MDLEVILVSISLCVFSCFIRRRIRNRQTAVMLRNSVIHVAINAVIIGIDSFRVAYNVYTWSRISSRQPLHLAIVFLFLVWNVIFMLGIGASVITQAVLCIQTSTERNMCCKRYRLHQSHEIIDKKDTATTNPASSCISQPSYTNFAVPYTGGFTQITTSTNSDRQSEQRQLIECTHYAD